MLLKHRQPISQEQAVSLLRTACRDALRHIDIPIIRGFSGDAPLYRLEGSQGERQSRSNEHYHTIIMDQFLPLEGYPKRCESIVCGNWLNLQYAGDYGATYAIFPFDGVPIGVTYASSSSFEFANRSVAHSFFAQDQWTLKRLTLSGALRSGTAHARPPAQAP